jgi:hypothetical protein
VKLWWLFVHTCSTNRDACVQDVVQQRVGLNGCCVSAQGAAVHSETAGVFAVRLSCDQLE